MWPFKEKTELEIAENQLARKNNIADFLNDITEAMVKVSLLVPACMWGYQTYAFLKTGDYMPFAVTDLFALVDQNITIDPSTTEWAGAAKVLNWVTSQNAGVVTIITAIFIVRLFVSHILRPARQDASRCRKEVQRLRQEAKEPTVTD